VKKNFVAGFDRVGRPYSVSVDCDAARLTNSLSQGPAGTKAAGFEEKIDTHCVESPRSNNAGLTLRNIEDWRRKLDLPSSRGDESNYGLLEFFPFFLASGFCPGACPLFSAVFSGGSFKIGATASR
jgi:hypothetical protein